jgi:hypothetical protein
MHPNRRTSNRRRSTLGAPILPGIISALITAGIGALVALALLAPATRRSSDLGVLVSPTCRASPAYGPCQDARRDLITIDGAAAVASSSPPSTTPTSPAARGAKPPALRGARAFA